MEGKDHHQYHEWNQSPINKDARMYNTQDIDWQPLQFDNRPRTATTKIKVHPGDQLQLDVIAKDYNDLTETKPDTQKCLQIYDNMDAVGDNCS